MVTPIRTMLRCKEEDHESSINVYKKSVTNRFDELNTTPETIKNPFVEYNWFEEFLCQCLNNDYKRGSEIQELVDEIKDDISAVTQGNCANLGAKIASITHKSWTHNQALSKVYEELPCLLPLSETHPMVKATIHVIVRVLQSELHEVRFSQHIFRRQGCHFS